MGHASYIGRVGALAVTLGVGWAIASAPGAAYADTSGSSDAGQSASDSQTSPAPTQSAATSATTKERRSGTTGSAGSSNTDGADQGSGTGSVSDDPDPDDSDPADSDIADRAVAEQDAAGQDRGAASKPVKSRRGDASPADTDASEAAGTVDDSDTSSAGQGHATGGPGSGATTTPAGPGSQAGAQTGSTQPASSSTPVTAGKPSIVELISDAVTALLTPRPDRTPASPLPGATMLGALAAARDELERNTLRRNGINAGQSAAALAADTPNVLVIGVDGTNLRRILATLGDDSNLFRLIQDSTTAASSIVGHTTISNPSWSSILTGAWGEKTGVINNVFTPWTYRKWPTVFTQLETLNPGIVTTSIADWNVISGIADSGLGADHVLNVSQQPDDPDWLKTDDKVGNLTAAAIAAAQADVANFMFSYFVGVDENGHSYGGDSLQYAEAIRNFDRNLGVIMNAVNTWEGINGEQWTIMMVTDHGHQPQKGLGHGFQSPDETSTFVIANNPLLFTQGAVNLKYSIVDVTPTVLTLFGFQPADGGDGVSITDLDDSTVTPENNTVALRRALNDAIAMYGYPDIGTNIALSVRTIAATVPYYVDLITNGIVGALQGLAAQDIFLISPLAALATVPVDIIGDLAYLATNIVAQIVARLTGVTGASIFPLQRPPTPTFPEAPDVSTPDLVALTCADGRVTGAVFACQTPAFAS